MLSVRNGLSRSEIVIALLAVLTLTAGVITLFIEVGTNIRHSQNMAALAARGQLALTAVAHDAEQAGFWGQAFDPLNIVLDATLSNNMELEDDCGAPTTWADTSRTLQAAWAYNVRRPLEQYDDVDADLGGVFRCFTSGEVKASTDVLAIRRVADLAIDPSSKHTNARIYLRAANNKGGLFQYSGAEPTHPTLSALNLSQVQDWLYTPTIYFIRSYSRTPGDDIPALCQKSLNSDLGFTTQCITEGIEDLQIDFGIDASGDGISNYYTAAPNDTEITQVSTLQIFVLARSLTPETRHQNRTTFQLGSKQVIKDDSYNRELYSMTISVKNPSRYRAMR